MNGQMLEAMQWTWIVGGRLKNWLEQIRGDHFEIKLIENCNKFEIFLFSKNRYIWIAKTDVPTGPGSSDHVAHVPARL